MSKYKATSSANSPANASKKEPDFVIDAFPTQLRDPRLWALFVISAVVLLVYYLRFNQLVGHPYVDDAYYVLLARALASGQGYTLINTPTPGLMPFYPPMFPLALAVIFKFSSSFPQNLWLLKLFSISSLLLGGVATFSYFARIRQVSFALAAGITFVLLLSPTLVFFATATLMSECFYVGLQMLLLLAFGYAARVTKPTLTELNWRYAIGLGALAGITFLTRSVALALLVALLLALAKERLWRSAALVLLGAVLIIGPWQLYTRSHAPSAAQKLEQQGYITQSYATQFWQRQAGVAEAGTIALSELPARVASNLGNIAGQQVGMLLLGRLLPVLGEIGLGFLSVILSLLAVVGWAVCLRQRLPVAELYVALSLGIIVLWPWEPTRFLLPLIPLLLFYVVQGGQALLGWWREGKLAVGPASNWAIASGFVWVLVAFDAVSNLEFISSLDKQRQRATSELGAFNEIQNLFRWVKENVAEAETVASLNPPLVYLYTERKCVSAQDPLGNWENWKNWGVRYLVLTSAYGVPQQDVTGKPIRIAYQSKLNPQIRVVDLGAPATRAAWPATTPSN